MSEQSIATHNLIMFIPVISFLQFRPTVSNIRSRGQNQLAKDSILAHRTLLEHVRKDMTFRLFIAFIYVLQLFLLIKTYMAVYTTLK